MNIQKKPLRCGFFVLGEKQMATNWDAILSSTNNLTDILMILRKVLAGLDAKVDLSVINETIDEIEKVKLDVASEIEYFNKVINESLENGLYMPFEKQSQLLAYLPVVSPTVAKALDTKKVWLWKDGVWIDTGMSELDKAISYANEQKVQKYSALNRPGVLYEVLDKNDNQTWVQISSVDGLPTTYARFAIRKSASIDDSKHLIINGESTIYSIKDANDNPTWLQVSAIDGGPTRFAKNAIKNAVFIEDSLHVIINGEKILYSIKDKNGNPTAISVRQSDGMFADFVIADIQSRLTNIVPNLDDLHYRPKPTDFQILSSIARGVTRHVVNKPLPAKITNFTNSTAQNSRLTFPNSYSDATPIVLVICFEGVGDQALDIRAAYSDVLNNGVLWARCQFHDDSYGSPKAMQDAIELYRKACEIAPIAGVIIVGNSMGGVAALNALTTESIPNILGVYLTDPVCDLRQRYDNGRSNEINTAYECNSATYTEKTKGYDPMLHHWSKFRGVPLSIVVTSNDSLVLKAQHTDKLVTKLANYNKISVIDTKAPDHNAPEEFIVTNLINFINQCASGTVITAI